MKNPFFHDETEIYEIEDVYKLFVENKETLNNLYQPRHNFVCGDRGTGKSMMLRYLEPYCQFQLHGGWENFLKKKDSFIAFYFPMPKGLITIRQFEKDIPSKEEIYAHYCNMLLFDKIIRTMCTQLSKLPKNGSVLYSFVDEIISLLRPLESSVSEIDEQHDRYTQPFEWLSLFIIRENERCMDFINFYTLRKVDYMGSLSDYHSFILPIAKLIKKLYNFDNSIYFLIDDAATTHIFECQMRVFNTWMSNRNHRDLSIKISAVPARYTTFLTIDGSLIDNKNDFQYIHLDNYGSKSEESIKKEIILILNKRLSEFGISAKKLFLEDESQLERILMAKKQIADSISVNKDIIDKNRYINRYTLQQFYKNMCNVKGKTANNRSPIERKYCGIDDIVAFSSYNVRDCLKICSKIFEKFDSVNSLKMHTVHPIPPDLQDSVMTELSKSENIGITLFKQEHDMSILIMLKNLIDGLGNLYRANLLNFDYAEYGVTAFQTDMSKLSIEQTLAIRIAVENRYLIRRFYSERVGSTVNIAYALNKMFFPYFKLELHPFAGRLKLQAETLSYAFSGDAKFIKLAQAEVRKEREKSEIEQISLFEIEKEDGIDDLKNNLSELF